MEPGGAINNSVLLFNNQVVKIYYSELEYGISYSANILKWK